MRTCGFTTTRTATHQEQDIHQVIGPFTLYKHREDLIDALLCAGTASLWAPHGSGRCQVPGLPTKATPATVS